MNRIKVSKLIAAVTAICCLLLPATLTGQAKDMPPASNKTQADHAPTPFSAAEIKAGCPRDRTMVFQIEMFGKSMLFRTTRFMSHFDDRTVLENITKTADGKKVGKTQIVTANWTDLQAHASFPAINTKITNVKHTVPAGTFDCYLYTITDTAAGKSSEKQLYFAKSLPGPPITYIEKADGKITYRMVMIKNK